MKPDADHALRVIASQMIAEIGPRLGLEYLKSDVEMMAGLLLAIAEDYDRAAAIRIEENRALRELFGAFAPEVEDEALRDRLTKAAATEDGSLRVSALRATNDDLRRLLVELHAFVEERPEEWARRIERAIWRELRASTARRAISFFPI